MALVSSIHALKCFASDSSLEAMHWMLPSGELVNETWCEAKQWKVGCSVSRSQPLVNVPNEEPQHRVWMVKRQTIYTVMGKRCTGCGSHPC